MPISYQGRGMYWHLLWEPGPQNAYKYLCMPPFLYAIYSIWQICRGEALWYPIATPNWLLLRLHCHPTAPRPDQALITDLEAIDKPQINPR